MTGSRIARELTSDGNVVIGDARCKFIFQRLRAGVLEVRIVGTDNGQFGASIIDEIAMAIFRERSLKLLIDASDAALLPASMSRAWARFFERNRGSLERVAILAGSKPVALSMAIIRHISNTGDLIKIYPDRETYEAFKTSVTTPA